jgi:hypothetical protein
MTAEELEEAQRRQERKEVRGGCGTPILTTKPTNMHCLPSTLYLPLECQQVIMQLAQQTRAERERAAEAKQAKEAQAQAKVDKMKADFLKRQLSKLRGKPQ